MATKEIKFKVSSSKTKGKRTTPLQKIHASKKALNDHIRRIKDRGGKILKQYFVVFNEETGKGKTVIKYDFPVN